MVQDLFSKITIQRLGLVVLLIISSNAQIAGQNSPASQQPSLQELKDKLQNIEREMTDLHNEMTDVQGQIKALEGPNGAAPAAAQPQGKAPAPATEAAKTGLGTMQLYGWAQLDSGYNFGQIDPAWFDVMRPSKLAAYKGEFAPNGTVFFSVRQTRFGVKTSTPTNYGDLKTIFEFELFGVGVDAGQTTFRLRHAWGEIGQFGGGQTWSPFMDIDVFPNSLEYWGPNAMVFFRNVQFRWMPVHRNNLQVWLAAERPGASADGGVYADRLQIANITPKFDLPDFSWRVRTSHEWGYLQVAGMFRKITWVANNPVPGFNIGDTVLGWGINTSTNLKFTKKDTLKMQVVYGAGIENYMNDAPLDVGVKTNPSQPSRPLKGVALPIVAPLAFVDHNWNSKFSSTIGYSFVNIWNANADDASDLRQGNYALTNLLYYPVKNVMFGGEFQFGRRVNFNDGWNVNDYKLQFSAKYNFSKDFTY